MKERVNLIEIGIHFLYTILINKANGKAFIEGKKEDTV